MDEEGAPLCKVEVDYAFADYVAMCRLHNRQHRTRPILLWSIFGLIVLSVSAPGFARGNIGGACVLPAIFICLALLAPVINRRQLVRAWRRQPGREARTVIEFTDSGVGGHTALVQSFLKWDLFTHYVQDDKVILLYQGSSLVLYVPKRSFENQEQLQVVQNLLGTKIGNTRHDPAARGFPVKMVEPQQSK